MYSEYHSVTCHVSAQSVQIIIIIIVIYECTRWPVERARWLSDTRRNPSFRRRTASAVSSSCARWSPCWVPYLSSIWRWSSTLRRSGPLRPRSRRGPSCARPSWPTTRPKTAHGSPASNGVWPNRRDCACRSRSRCATTDPSSHWTTVRTSKRRRAPPTISSPPSATSVTKISANFSEVLHQSLIPQL